MTNVNFGGGTAYLSANTSQFQSAIGRAQQVLQQLEPVVARQWWGLQNLGRAFGAIGGVVAKGLTMAIRESMAWEDAMAGVSRTTFDTEKSAEANAAALRQIEQELRAVAREVPVAASQLAAIAEEAGALGIRGEDIAEFTKQFAMLTATTNVTLDSIDEVARVLNIMGVPIEQFDNFVSTLIELGRSTAATETEILNMSKRLAPMGRLVGMTTEEILALSAATLSLGPRAEAGSSALTRLFGDISKSIGEGGDALDNWGDLLGRSGDELARAWATDPSKVVEDIVVAIGRYEGNAAALSSTLEHLDQNNVRNVITLGALASGVADVGSKQSSLIAINRVAEQAWARNVAMTQVAQQRFATTSAQVQLLRNRLAEVANTLGRAILPALRFVVDMLTSFAAGFHALPEPVQIFIASIVALIGFVALLAAGIVALVGPLVLAMQTLRTLSGIFSGTAATAATTNASTSALNVTLGQTAMQAQLAAFGMDHLAASQVAAAASGRAAAAGQAATATSATAAAGATTAAAAGTTAFTSKLTRLGRVGIIVASLVAAATVAITLFGRRARESEKAAEDATQADLALVDAIDQQARGLNNAADEWVLNRLLVEDVTDAAIRARVSLADLVSIISGRADPTFAKATVDRLNQLAEAGDEQVEKLLGVVARTRAVFKASAEGSGQLTTARKNLGIATGDAADQEERLGEASDETRKKQDDINQATIDYVDAVLSAKAAALDYKDAQREYQKVVSEAADPADRMAEAENKLARARLNQEEAAQEVIDAERDLAEVRDRQQERLKDAEDGLADARDKYADSLDEILELEEELRDLREQGAKTQLEMLEATNKLANAQLRLRDAHRTVRDAEWQLQYLREEGASARDIENAEISLDKARQDVLNETEAVGEAEENLAELRDQADRARRIASMERDLAAAYRESAAAQRDIADRSREVDQLRADITADTAYREAQIALKDAQIGVAESARQTREAEAELQRLRAGGLEDEVARARLELEQAGYRLAQSNAAVTEQEARMRGEFWDAGRSAHALAEELAILAQTGPDAGVVQDWERFVGILRGAKPGKAPTEGKGGVRGAAGGGGVGGSFEDIPGLTDPKKIAEKVGNPLVQAFKSIATMIGGQLLVWLARAILSRLGAGAVAGVLGGPIGIIVGILVSLFLDWFLKTELGKKIVSTIWDGIKAAGRFLAGFGQWLWDHLVAPILSLFGIGGSPSRVFMDIGRDLLGGLWEGIKLVGALLFNWWFLLPKKMIEVFLGVGRWLWQHGKDLLQGLWNGALEIFGFLWNWYTGMPGRLIGALVGIGSWLLEHGRNLIRGLLGGIHDIWNNHLWPFISGLAGRLVAPFLRAHEWLLDKGKDVVRGLLNGLRWGWDNILKPGWNKIIESLPGDAVNFLKIGSPSKVFEEIGRNIIRGLDQGVRGNLTMIDAAMQRLVDSATVPLDTKIASQLDPSMMRDFALWQAQAGAFSGRKSSEAAPTTNNNGDTININGADNRDAIEIADEVMFRKLVRVR